MSDFGSMIDSDADRTTEAHLRNYVLVVSKSGKIMCTACLLHANNTHVGVLYSITN